jgi:hypothetical protein
MGLVVLSKIDQVFKGGCQYSDFETTQHLLVKMFKGFGGKRNKYVIRIRPLLAREWAIFKVNLVIHFAKFCVG